MLRYRTESPLKSPFPIYVLGLATAVGFFSATPLALAVLALIVKETLKR
jgi:hypothetical protein